MAQPKRREWIDGELIAALRSPLKPADAELRWMLVGLLLGDLAGVAIVTIVGHGAIIVWISAFIALNALAAVVVVRLRRYSNGGFAWFGVSLLYFLGLNVITVAVGAVAGLFASYPFPTWVATEVLGALPLVVGVVALSRKLRDVAG